MSEKRLTVRVCGAAGAALLLLSLAGCPLTEREYLQAKASSDELAEKVARLERALAEVRRSPAPAPAATTASVPDAQLQRRIDDQGKSLADLRARLDEVSAQVASLQGRAEVFEKGLTGERESSRVSWGQIEARLSDLDKKLDQLQTATARPTETARPVPPPPGPERSTPPAPAVEKRSPAQALYDEAYTLYRKQGKHEEAREKFKIFMQTYPDASLVPNAYFWIGESYYDQAQYEPAILEYDNVLKKFPKSDKVPSALLKQAFAFDALNDPVGAKTLLKKLIRDFPKSDQAAIAQKKLDSLGE